jgi:hypothetical protein
LKEKPDVKRTLGRAWLRWEDYFKMDLKEIDWEGVDRTNLPQDSD